MNIAILLRQVESLRGAEQSMMTLANLLSKNHTVQVFGLGENEKSGISVIRPSSIRSSKLPVAVERSFQFVAPSLSAYSRVKSFNPDLVLSQHWLSLLGAHLFSSHNIPHILFIHDYEFIPEFGTHGLYGRDLDRGFPIDIPNQVWSPVNTKVLEYIFDNTSLIVANSNHVRSVYSQRWDIDVDTIYPFVDPERVKVKDTGEKIAHITPSDDKGINVTLDVARNRPEDEFVIVGELPNNNVLRQKICSIDNINLRGYVEDIRRVYRESKIILTPSKWPEPYGMVPVEAGINGIPTLCSGRGGLSEAIGSKKFIIESNQPKEYARAIDTISSEYDEYRKLAQENARSRVATKSYGKFKQLVQNTSVGEI